MRQMVEHEGDEAWPEIVRRYDEYSLYEFLKSRGFSEGAIEFYAVMNFVEADLHNSFVEVLREELGGAYVDMQTIAGGMDRAAQRVLRRAAGRRPLRRRGARDRAGRRWRDPPLPARERSGQLHGRLRDLHCALLGPAHDRALLLAREGTGDPAAQLPRLDQDPASRSATASGRQDDGIVGGATVTDLPIRRLNYPPPDPTTARGVLLASYTWGQDALQWGAMDEDERIEEALDDVARIHPRISQEFEVGASHAWYGDSWARGAFALFAPEQQTQLQAAIVQPEGRVYFAGEHCSLYHAWIQGALESGIRAAREINDLPVS